MFKNRSVPVSPGTSAADEDPDGDSALFTYNLRFPGQYYDQETTLNYNYFRDYDPSTGRYVESDPIGLNGGVNTYAYAAGNPIVLFDSLGLMVELRCRQVGDPYQPDFLSRQVRRAGGEHCYLVVSCWVPEGIPETHIGYPYHTSRPGRRNNDREYSGLGSYRVVPHRSPPKKDCADCAFEKCLATNAEILGYIGYDMQNYSAVLGPNSNSYVRRLIEMCGGSIGVGRGPITGWDDAGRVGF